MAGLVGSKMALDGYSDSADRPLQPGEAGPDGMPPEQRMEQPGQVEEPELPDDQFDEALERVMAAALKAMQQPEIKRQIVSIKQSPEPAMALAETCYNLSMALYEKSGQSIPDEVMPAAGAYILGNVSKMIDASAAMSAEALDQMMANYATEDEGAA